MIHLYRLLLRFYLKSIHPVHEWFLDRLSIRAHGGVHPKNIFNYRSRFFLENVTANDVVVDIACGTGRMLKALAPRIRAGLGLDYSPINLRICESLPCSQNLKFRQVDILAVDYTQLKQEMGFNIVILSHILEHLEHPVEFLQHVAAPRLLICVPSQENWRAQLKKSLNLPYLSDRSHFREYTHDMLKSELHQAGYRVNYIGFNGEGEIICSAERASQ